VLSRGGRAVNLEASGTAGTLLSREIVVSSTTRARGNLASLRAKDLVTFARQQGYRVDELVEIIQDVS
jgi:hypothetical protein